MSVADRIEATRQQLTPAERRVADVVLLHPQAVAFGTVAELASRAATSGATVVRLAAKLGYTGYTELQDAVQDELGRRLRPAAERIRDTPPTDLLARSLAAELDNVHATLDAVDRTAFEAVVTALSDLGRGVGVLPGEASLGIGFVLADTLSLLRPGVALVGGTDVRVARQVASLGPSPVVLTVDFKRYERWVLRAAKDAVGQGALVVAVTDSRLSPLADLAEHTFVSRLDGVGPFDSQVGTLALVNALVAGVAAHLRAVAVSRLDAVEDAWRRADTLAERP